MRASKKEGSLRRPKLAVVHTFLFFTNLRYVKHLLKNRNMRRNPHAGTQKGGVPEEAKMGRAITRFVFFTCALGAPMTA